VRRTRQLARLLVALDDVGRERRSPAAAARRATRMSLGAR
jgi:hypothetical protein